MNAPVSSSRTVYIIQKLYWEYNDNFFELANDTPVKAFRSRANAEKHRRALEAAEREVWVGANLGRRYGALELMTTLSPEEFITRLRSLGLPTPPRKPDSSGDMYANIFDDAWWKRVWKSLRPDQSDRFWELLDRIASYEIVEVTLEE